MKALRRGLLSTLFGSALWLASSAALADGEACINDIDCPGAECGGPVCNWNKPQGAKFTCNPAGTDPVGKDGWCTTDADCKCMGVGAKCVAPYCTFTKPPAGAAGSGAGGSSGTAGSTSTAGTGTAGTGTAGTGTAGTGTGGTGTSTAGTGSTSSSSDSGGCSVSAPGGAAGGAAVALGLLGVGIAFARRRR